MNEERYLVLFPDGSFRWIHTQHDQMASAFKEAIGCDWLERVTLPFGFCCVVDEVGKVKQNRQRLNVFASLFYPGTLYGDPLVGPVVFVRIGLYEGESDWIELTQEDISVIEQITGRKVPA